MTGKIRWFNWGDGLLLALLLAHAAAALFWVQLYHALSFGVIFLSGPLALAGLACGIGGIGFAFADQRRGRLLRHSLIVPAALLLVLLCTPFLWATGLWASAQWAVIHESHAFRPMRRGLAPIHLLVEGIPDGGTAIVRTQDGNPEAWAPLRRQETVNGTIRGCSALRAGYYLCSFG